MQPRVLYRVKTTLFQLSAVSSSLLALTRPRARGAGDARPREHNLRHRGALDPDQSERELE